MRSGESSGAPIIAEQSKPELTDIVVKGSIPIIGLIFERSW
jgi:hypothetical protein